MIDKPHFLATIPRGQHILQTALVRLRSDLELPDLIPRTDWTGSPRAWCCSW